MNICIVSPSLGYGGSNIIVCNTWKRTEQESQPSILFI